MATAATATTQEKRHKPRYMKALRSRKDGDDTELEFQNGDFVVVLDDTGDMWEVVCGNKCGYMPKDALSPVDNRFTKEDPFPVLTFAAYTGENAEELSAPAKSSLVVVDQSGGWWLSTDGSTVGWFPSNFCESASYTSTELRARVVSKYSTKEPEHLCLDKGDSVRVVAEKSSTMLRGYKGSQAGVFPSDCVEMLESDGTEKLVRDAVVLTDYKPQFKNEVAVKKDDEITALGEDDCGWYTVISTDNKVGRVPAAHLRIREKQVPVHDSTFAVAATDIDGGFIRKGQALGVHTKNTNFWWGVYQWSTRRAQYVRSVDVDVLDFKDEEREIVPMRATRDLAMKDDRYLSFKKGDLVRVYKETTDGILVGATRTAAGFVHKEDLEPLAAAAK